MELWSVEQDECPECGPLKDRIAALEEVVRLLADDECDCADCVDVDEAGIGPAPQCRSCHAREALRASEESTDV